MFYSNIKYLCVLQSKLIHTIFTLYRRDISVNIEHRPFVGEAGATTPPPKLKLDPRLKKMDVHKNPEYIISNCMIPESKFMKRNITDCKKKITVNVKYRKIKFWKTNTRHP